MEPLTKEKTKSGRVNENFLFITEIVQGGRIRPATYIHDLQMPHKTFEEMKDLGVIDLVFLSRREKNANGKAQDPIAFFEFKSEMVIVSFRHIYNREDFRTMVDRFLIIKAYGYYPCKANWVSKMNFDKTARDLVVLQRTRTGNRSHI